MRRFWVSLGVALSCLSGAAMAQGADGLRCDPDQAVFLTPEGQTLRFAVELADTPESRARGLMWRELLAPGQGMLFIYESPRPAAFWMKNTLIPLDMIFIDALGMVRHVHPMARPHDLTPVPGAVADDPAPERLMVLEIAGGEAARLGLAPGAALAHPGLPQDSAALPCR